MDYNTWLIQEIDRQYSNSCNGEPQAIGSMWEYEGRDEDGRIEYSQTLTYTCEECEDTTCSYWKDFHVTEWEEIQKALEEDE